MDAQPSESSRHARNVLWLLAAEAVQKVLTLILFSYVSRRLSIEENAWYSAFIALFPLFTVFTNAGLYDVLVRDVAQRRKRAALLYAPALLLQAGITLILMAVLWGGAPALGFDAGLVRVLLIGAPAVALWTWGRMQHAILAAHGHFYAISILNMLLRTALVLGSLALLYLGAGAQGLVAWMLPVYAVHLGLSWCAVRRIAGAPPMRLAMAPCAYLLRQGWPIALGGLAATAACAMDLPLLTAFGAPDSPGYYAIAIRFYLLLAPVADIFAAVLYPVLSRTARESAENQCAALERAVRTFAAFGLPMAAGMIVLARPVVATLCGERYLPSAPAVAALTAFMAIEMLNRGLIEFARAQRRQGIPLGIYGSGVAIKAILCLWAIPRWDIPGLLALNAAFAAWTTLGMMASLRLMLPGASITKFLRGALLRPVLAALIMACGLWAFRDAPLACTVSLGALLYTAAAWTLGLYDIAFIRNTLRMRRNGGSQDS